MCKYYPWGQFQAALVMSLTTELGRDSHTWLLQAGGSQVQHTHTVVLDQMGVFKVTASGYLFTEEPTENKGMDRNIQFYFS